MPRTFYAGCPDLPDPEDGRCRRCLAELPARRRAWCSDGCRQAVATEHVWELARTAAIRRDGFTCVRCGFVGWLEATRLGPITIDSPRTPGEYPPGPEAWAVAAGTLDPHDLEPTPDRHDDAWWRLDRERRERVAAAVATLPEIVRELTDAERDAYLDSRPIHSSRFGAGSHTLEVNHKRPRDGDGYNAGCHHHAENLETLCRPCHVDETTRQRLGLPSWRDDPRPRDEIRDGGVQLELSL